MLKKGSGKDLQAAVVLLNMGGPRSEDEVEPYIRRLLSDPEMIRIPIPQGWRKRLASWIAGKRAPRVVSRFRLIGGASPVWDETLSIAKDMEVRLGVPVYAAMQYMPPFPEDIVSRLRSSGIRHAVLLPLYPQFSTVTTDPALKDIRSRMHPDIRSTAIPSHHRMSGLIGALEGGIRKALSSLSGENRAHILFTAHSIPLRYVRQGDPYVAQVRETAETVMAAFPMNVSWSLAFQSRLGPLRWQGPFVEDAVKSLKKTDVLLVQPLSFATENLETLYDLDIALRDIARAAGIDTFIRLPAPGRHPLYRDGLAVLAARTMKETIV